MVKRRGNPNFGKPVPLPPAGESSFEEVVKAMGLSPAEYADSAELKKWVHQNKNTKYVPTNLLKIWGFVVEDE
jgi:hypothetical protein